MAYRRRFGGRRRGPVHGPVMSSRTTARKAAKCRGCGGAYAVGDEVVRLRLRKNYRQSCVTCGHKLPGVKFFHPQCVPSDHAKAMGYNPHNAPPPPGNAVPPPPKPMTVEEHQLAALLQIEKALSARIANRPALKKELESLFNTYNGCKARALRGITPGEELVGMKMALKKAIDLVF